MFEFSSRPSRLRGFIWDFAMTHLSHSVEETESIAGELAKTLIAGDCIALEGPLGAGKTQFIRGLAMALGANPRAVSSPTFVLLNIYRGGRLTLFHLDAYRTGGADDFESIGFAELLEQQGVVVAEWADRITRILPDRRIQIAIEVLGESERRITIERLGK
jgi:tRNA threonylcarbamoyladenosine biosynthesis protein TsaE